MKETLWPTGLFRDRLVRHLRAKLHDHASAEDLAQEALLRAVLSARRLGVVARDECERIAWRISRDLLADHVRGEGRHAKTNRSLRSLRVRSGDETPFSVGAMRKTLRAIRFRLEPLLGRRQRALIAVVLDEGIVTIRALAERLHSDRANVRRMIRGIAKKIMKLTLEDEREG